MDDRIESLLAALTLEEKTALVAGIDLWRNPGVERLGIAPLKVSDGPSGVRGERFSGTASTSFPCATALAATWDPDLVGRVGEAIGDEARGKGVRVLLGPTVNIHRHPLTGRHFECYSEDPFLSARMAVAFVSGVQSRGVGCSVKHFVANDSEFERMTISSEVPERALREIYLPPFEAAVREAGAWSVMAAYNRLGGTYCSEHPALLRGILKEEWRFDGFVVSDWFGTHSTADAANAGLDLEMPGPPQWFGDRLAAAVRDGAVEEAVVDEMVRRLLRVAERTGALGEPEPSEEVCGDDPARSALARETATEAVVLLRNEGGLLPLDAADLHTLAVIGPNAEFVATQGGGSAVVTPHHVVTPLDAVRARAGTDIEVAFERGCATARPFPALDGRWLAGGEMTVEYYDGDGFEGPPVHTERSSRGYFVWLGKWSRVVNTRAYSVRLTASFVPDESGPWTFALTSVGKSRLLVDGEVAIDNWDARQPGSTFFGFGSAEATAGVSMTGGEAHALTIEYRSGGIVGGLSIGCHPPVPPDALERAAACAARADVAVLVVGTSSDWESEGQDRRSMDLPGGQRALIERVAAANPRTVVVVNAAAPVTTDWVESVPVVVALWFPGQDGGGALADVLFGDADPGGRLPTTIPARLEDTPAFTSYPGEAGHVRYGEGIFVGYRWYDARGIEPRFPFGHGLSYTTFEYGDAVVDPADAGTGEPVRVSVDVTNTGPRTGSEVVQCYVRDVECTLARPEQELKAFAKVRLEPGEARTVALTLDERALSHWDPTQHAWVAEPGEFEIRVGASSRDIRARATFTLRAPPS